MIRRRERDDSREDGGREKKVKDEEKVMRSKEKRERPQNRSLDLLYPQRRG